ncbi:glycosyltransferase [Aeromonas salmonicida]|uniref:glycosyltransferase n=1 Tax=Aeromonas salmonicida TaxID=645 RepID=UPI0013A703D2|nr:glycosyltransferase [Aeromonas salmonicida]
MKNTYLFFIRNAELGGAQTYFIRVIEYLLSNGEEVAVLANCGDYVAKYFEQSTAHIDVIYIPDDINCSLWKSPSVRDSIAQYGAQLRASRQGFLRVVTYNVPNVLFSIFLFNQETNWSLTAMTMHHEEWTHWEPGVGFVQAEGMNPHYRNRLWNEYRHLLIQLDKTRSLFWGGYLVKQYMDFVFEHEFHVEYICQTPIEYIPALCLSKPENKKLNILWCGRFDSFKSPGLVQFSSELEQFSIAHPDLSVSLHLVGRGHDKAQLYIQNAMAEIKNVTVFFDGEVPFFDMPQYISAGQFDFGIAMGSTPLLFGSLGLPTILIDVGSISLMSKMKGTWLHETDLNITAGYGLVLEVLGEDTVKLYGRRSYYDLIGDYITWDSTKWRDVSQKTVDYVKCNHAAESVFSVVKKSIDRAKWAVFDIRFPAPLATPLLQRLLQYNGKIYIFGAGGLGCKFYEIFSEYCRLNPKYSVIKIVGYIDNSPHKHGMQVGSLRCQHISTVSIVDSFFIVASDYHMAIIEQLGSLGVADENICSVGQSLRQTGYI